MKHVFTFLFASLFSVALLAQDSLNVTKLFNWNDTTLVLNYRDARYSEVWGFVQDGREYGVIGSTYGCHIFDVTDPQNIYMADEVAANLQGYDANHRDYHDYNGYLYAVGDQEPATLQIIDLSPLPDSVSVVYDSFSLFSTTHNIFIDTASALLYALNPSSSQYSMIVYSLTDPINPQFVYGYDATNTVHDAYVRNDTAYLNCGNNDGFRVYDFTVPTNPVLLATLTSYQHQGYNHSGWLTEDGKHYLFADENYGLDVKVCDVSDLGNINVVAQFTSGVTDSSVAHNIIIRGDYAFISYYNDGLQIFDVSDPQNPVKTGFYDTYPNPQKDNFRGAWGVYPYLPSKRVLVSDRNSGLYVFDANAAIGEEPVGLKEKEEWDTMNIYPNPANDFLNVVDTRQEETVFYSIKNMQGRVVQNGVLLNTKKIDIHGLLPGLYFLEGVTSDGISTSPFVKM